MFKPYIPCRLALLLQLSVAVGATWVVEQPRGSLLFEHDRLSELVESWMGRVNETRLFKTLADLVCTVAGNFWYCSCVGADPPIARQGIQTIILDDALQGSVSEKDKPMEQLLFDTTFRLWQVNTCSNAATNTVEDCYSWADEEGPGWVYRDSILEVDTAASSIASLCRCMSKHGSDTVEQ